MFIKQSQYQIETPVVTSDVKTDIATDAVEPNTLTSEPVNDEVEVQVTETSGPGADPEKVEVIPDEPLKEDSCNQIPQPKTLISSGAMARQFAFSEEQFYAWLLKHDVLTKVNGRYLLDNKFAGYFFATNIAYTFRHPGGEIDQGNMLMWTDLGVGFLSTLFENDRK